jgi:hypothetical protein
MAVARHADDCEHRGMKSRLLVSSALLVVACGGKAVVDPPLGSGGGSSSADSSTTSTTGGMGTTGTTGTATAGTSTSGGAPDCRVDGCAASFVCHQPTGACLRGCDPGDGGGCLAGVETCDTCATSSCPNCKDCRAACVPANGAAICADHKDCPETDWCVYSTNACAKRCGTGSAEDVCAEGVCQQCYTSSCATCDDCLSVCVGMSSG